MPDVRRLESKAAVGSITCNAKNLTSGLEGFNEDFLIFGGMSERLEAVA